MAKGDVFYFDQFYEDAGNKLHQLSTDTFKLGLVTNVTIPLVTTADPRWGAGGTTDFSVNEVTPGGNYPAGGPSLSATITDNWTRSAGVNTQDFDDVSIVVDPANPSGVFWGIVYNDTDPGKRAVGFIDIGAPVDLSAGAFSITWHVSGFGTLS